MSDRTTINKGFKLRISELGLYKPLPQNVPQVADNYRAVCSSLLDLKAFWRNGKSIIGK